MRRVTTVLGWAVVIGLFAAWVVLLRPVALGGSATYVLVRGDSMLPTYQPGDLVIVRAAAAYRAGDIVAFQVPAGEIGEGQVVLHRLVADEGATFVAQGDNNAAPDPWAAEADRILGRAWIALPGAGRAVMFIARPVIAAGLAMAVVVAMVLARQPQPVRRRRQFSLGQRLDR